MAEVHLLFYIFIFIGIIFLIINFSKIIRHNLTINQSTEEKLQILNSSCINCNNNTIKAFKRKYTSSAVQQSENGKMFTTTPRCGVHYYIECTSCKKIYLEWNEYLPCNNLNFDIKGSSGLSVQITPENFYPLLKEYLKNRDSSGTGFTGCLGLVFWFLIVLISTIFIWLTS